jgi:hypothetical protein
MATPPGRAAASAPPGAPPYLAGHPTATVLDASSPSATAGGAPPAPQAEPFPEDRARALYAFCAAHGAPTGGGAALSLFDRAFCDWDGDDPFFVGGEGAGGPAGADAGAAGAAAGAAPAAAETAGEGEGGLSAAATGLEKSAADAERELSRVLDKASFLKLAEGIVGQFNNGFIIAGLPRAGAGAARGGGGGGAPAAIPRPPLDLFILDQHACDEKSRYEALRASTTIHTQRLLIPRPIALSAAEELTVTEHLPVFEANGFHLAFDGGAPAGSRLRLLAHPFSKGRTFGDEDIQELASLVAEAADGRAGSEALAALRLPRLNAMFASRACRSAIMIGTALRRDTMRRVVAHMADMAQPWNCPHGRPTMRHLVDAGALRDAGLLAGALEPAGPRSKAGGGVAE